MKHPKITINIPKPCNEDWNEMIPTQKGAFCNICTKEVIDFTTNSDEYIMRHLQKNENICGRFQVSQLNRKLMVSRKKQNHWLSYVASFLLPITLFSQEIEKDYNNTLKTEQTTTNYTSLKIGSKHLKEKTLLKKQNRSLAISGTVTDDTGLPLPGAKIFIKRTKTGTTTDFDGNYKITVPENSILEIHYIGYKTIEFKATHNKHNISLKSENNQNETMITAGMVSSPRWIDYCEKNLTIEQQENRKRIQNYFAFQKKKWRERREKRRNRKAVRKAEKLKKSAHKSDN